MSDETTVNSQVTDAVTQTNVNVVGEAPSQALGSLYQMAAHANGMAMNNSVTNQHNLNQLNSSIVAQAIAIINGKPS